MTMFVREDLERRYNELISEVKKELILLDEGKVNEKELKEFINLLKRKIEIIKGEFLSKKGTISVALSQLAKLDEQSKKSLGKEINQLKTKIEEDIKDSLLRLQTLERKITYKADIDLSIEYSFPQFGAFHILTKVQNDLIDVFRTLGFEFVDGIEIEDEYHNFEALNIDSNHPARDMWDTFFFDGGILRTHTSNMQIRILEKRRPPIKVISSGKCYRRDNMDATHSFQFHQLEGFAIDKDISFSDLIRVLYKFVKLYFGEEFKINFVPSYFPFTEPSAEMSISCFKCFQQDKNCSLCKGTGWIEILGCGMINPIVLKNVNIDPDQFSGFAFGMGIERIAMLKYKVPDIRMFYRNYYEFCRIFA